MAIIISMTNGLLSSLYLKEEIRIGFSRTNNAIKSSLHFSCWLSYVAVYVQKNQGYFLNKSWFLPWLRHLFVMMVH